MTKDKTLPVELTAQEIRDITWSLGAKIIQDEENVERCNRGTADPGIRKLHQKSLARHKALSDKLTALWRPAKED